MINSCNFNCNSNKELYSNISDKHYLIEHRDSTSNNSENKKITRNKKKYSTKNFNINQTKKTNIHFKANSSLNTKQLNTNYIINNNINLNNDNLKNKNGNIKISIEKNNINIKDSILHIDKIYIKKDNSNSSSNSNRNKKDNKKGIIYENNNNKKGEIKIEDEIMKTVGNDIKVKNEKISSTEYRPFKMNMNYSVKAINVHRNINLITKNNKEIKKKKK